MGLEFLVPIFGILIVLVPITGLTVVLTAKYAVRPIVEGLAQLRREGGYPQPAELHIQLRDLSEQVEQLSREIHQLKEAQAFDRRLLEGERTGPGS